MLTLLQLSPDTGNPGFTSIHLVQIQRGVHSSFLPPSSNDGLGAFVS